MNRTASYPAVAYQLRLADFKNADLANADLQGADLDCSDFTGAKINLVRNLEKAKNADKAKGLLGNGT